MEQSLKELKAIPGIGRSIARDLYQLGFRKLSDLKDQDPEEMYRRSNELAGITIDRCLLYTYRCAVYFASHKRHDPEKLKWWNWKDN